MQIRTTTLVRLCFILTLYALLGNLNIFEIQKVLADKDTSNGQERQSGNIGPTRLITRSTKLIG